jgi:hypothetical protein
LPLLLPKLLPALSTSFPPGAELRFGYSESSFCSSVI